MAEFPSITSPRSLERFLGEVGNLTEPERVSIEWLRSVGFKSSNDRELPRVLEFIGFLDSSRKPTEKWRQYRSKSISRTVLAAAIREGYSALYRVRSDAHERTTEELRDFFSTHTKGSGEAIRRRVNAFRALCSLADFSQIPESETVKENLTPAQQTTGQPQRPSAPVLPPTPTLHINVQIHIASDADAEQIDQIFESMAKHLYSKETDAS